MDQYLIKNTTKEQREQIVRDSLGYSGFGCEGGGDGYDLYIPYIEGEMELKEVTMNYRARYTKDMQGEERAGCGMGRQ